MNQSKTPQQLHDDLQLMRQLRTPIGFYKYFFSLLPKHPTRKAAFDEANQKHYEFFNEYRYSDYNSFKATVSVRHKKKRNK